MKHKGRRLLRNLLLFAVVLIVAAAVFFGLFYVTDVEVVGNTRYSAAQISEMTLKGPVSYNSVLMSVLNKSGCCICGVRSGEISRKKPFAA